MRQVGLLLAKGGVLRAAMEVITEDGSGITTSGVFSPNSKPIHRHRSCACQLYRRACQSYHAWQRDGCACTQITICQTWQKAI